MTPPPSIAFAIPAFGYQLADFSTSVTDPTSLIGASILLDYIKGVRVQFMLQLKRQEREMTPFPPPSKEVIEWVPF